MVQPEPCMRFSKSHLAERSAVTQGGVEGAQGTPDPPLELYSIQRPCVVIPFTTVQECAALFRCHSTSNQDLDKSRGVPGFDRWHRKFPHWLSLSMDVGLYGILIENSQPIEGGRKYPV